MKRFQFFLLAAAITLGFATALRAQETPPPPAGESTSNENGGNETGGGENGNNGAENGQEPPSPAPKPEDDIAELNRRQEKCVQLAAEAKNDLEWNRHDDAIRKCEEALALFPEGEPKIEFVRFLLANAVYSSGDYARAVTLFEPLVTAHPDETDIRRALSLAYIQTGQPDKAAPLIDDLLRRDPNDWATIANNALRHYNTQQTEKALELYRQAAAIADAELKLPQPDLHLAIARCLIDLKKYADAMPEYEAVMAAHPMLTEPVYRAAQCQAAAGKEAEARILYETYYNRTDIHDEFHREVAKLLGKEVVAD